ncbi:unnamed protein product [Pleuronectes platessa]|uniref:Uncharacterized protein n=1 Tax=Pleuronectes platessa TaxID=8262 RepID=A0A9N7YCU6_PLEPL|nr:unnamed protein product [Pleuronectes platessa]
MATVEELKLRVRELENELIKCKQKQVSMEEALHRPRIDKMSAEVVDSNPYSSCGGATPCCESLHMWQHRLMELELTAAVFSLQSSHGVKENGHRGGL